MYAGIDIGTSLIKLILGESIDDARCDMHPYPSAHLREETKNGAFIERLLNEGVSRICVTGSGARYAAKLASEAGIEVCDYGPNPIAHEIKTLARGAQHIMRLEHPKSTEFLLVSIGTGVSFTRVSQSDIRMFSPGLSVGGGTIAQLAGLQDIPLERIGYLAERGCDTDLLMKHVFEGMEYPQSEFIIASLGRLKETWPSAPFDPDYCAGLLKMVATLTIGHILTIAQIPEWKWNGPVMFVGTPVGEYAFLRRTLHEMSLAVGIKPIVPQHELAVFAGAFGAFLQVSDQP